LKGYCIGRAIWFAPVRREEVWKVGGIDSEWSKCLSGAPIPGRARWWVWCTLILDSARVGCAAAARHTPIVNRY